MKQAARDLIEQGDKLFADRQGLLGLWQTTAENFYPQRADFTTTRSLGTEFASHLMTGLPVLVHRDLSNQLSGMLRPRGKPWFYARTSNEKINDDPTAKAWLDRASEVQRLVMEDRDAQFVRATKQGDNDFTAFGQCVISIDVRRDKTGLLYRPWHLRDVVWCENDELAIDHVERNWALPAQQLCDRFPKTVSPKVKQLCTENHGKDRYREIKCRHIVLPAAIYSCESADGTKKHNTKRFPFTSIYIDIENQVVLEEVPQRRINYVIPRWSTVSGSQYAFSPATVAGIADARLLQSITLTLLEAGQKAVDPPMLARKELIEGGANLYSGGITYVDADHDDRMGQALVPMPIDAGHLEFGVEREQRIEGLLKEAFYLNQIRLPDIQGGDKMTAYEVSKRNEEYIRAALPLFEPMEVEYNGQLCDMSFDMINDLGGFGSPYDMPQILRDATVQFRFESPLQAASGRANSQALLEAAQLIQVAAQFDQSAVHRIDWSTAAVDAIEGAGAPAKWIVPEEQAQQATAAANQQMKTQKVMGEVHAGAQTAEQVGKAAQALQAAGVLPGQPPVAMQPQTKQAA